MKQYKVLNLSKDIILLENVNLADSFFTRLKGLLGKTQLSEGQGIIIKPCNSVHTIGMKFAIDVAFIDNDNVVNHIINDMAPGKTSPIIRKAKYVIEAKSRSFEGRLDLGDKVLIEII